MLRKIETAAQEMFAREGVLQHRALARTRALDRRDHALYLRFIDFPEIDGILFEAGQNDGLDELGFSWKCVEVVHGVGAGVALAVQASIKSNRSPAAVNASP